jgi:hypothetical protein
VKCKIQGEGGIEEKGEGERGERIGGEGRRVEEKGEGRRVEERGERECVPCPDHVDLPKAHCARLLRQELYARAIAAPVSMV